MNIINNIEVYNKNMSMSMYDKTFFIDKIDAKLFVDFGCADGALMEFCKFLVPDINFIGYDIDPKMVCLAKDRMGEHAPFTIDWKDVSKEIFRVGSGGKTAIILSSLIHEVYSYGSQRDVDLFWERVFNTEFNYIVIRDLIPSLSINRTSDMNDVACVLRESDDMLIKFEQTWGSIEQNKNLVHYLMKYRYKENRDREIRENYFPLYREELLRKIPKEYKITFHDHYVLPYVKNQVKKDFGIDLMDNTHMKLILERQ